MSSGRLLPPDLVVLERGWLSSNSLLMLGDARGAVIVDTGYCTHRAQTVELVQTALGPSQTLRLIVNTHLHSDHCGGNAELARRHAKCAIWIPPGHYRAAVDWDESVLSYAPTGQQCERFQPTRAVQPGELIDQGGREWQVLAAPGHDPHSLILFEPVSGILASADALWEHGFGIVLPELDGETGFDEVERTLDLIEGLPVRAVVPGHGQPFDDMGRALGEARSRLAFFRRHPERHTRHAAKALLMFHLLEVGRCSRQALDDWLERVPIHGKMWRRHFSDQELPAWTEGLVQELAQSGTLRVEGGTISLR
ncbi:MBL fold metallo-hydrolase [Pelomonas sp. KK5]|uniref:MBL fold metallo-hydrolase n=1 Tax=Pelomonas sp. KK5 TaxID=1855730 RepID=UPI00097BACF4|nr:MBL fold metallo-hydrolase [Pelomonas sp. KK5]